MRNVMLSWFLVSTVLLIGSIANADGDTDLIIRLTPGSAAEMEEVEFSGEGGDATAEVEGDTGWQLDVLGVMRFFGKSNVGGVLGFGLFVAEQTAEDEIGDEAELSAAGVQILAGLAVKASDRVTLEVTPVAGIGSASQDITGMSSGTGPYALYGLRGGIMFQVADNIELGLDAGYYAFESDGEVEFEDEDATIDATFKGEGARLGASLGIRF